MDDGLSIELIRPQYETYVSAASAFPPCFASERSSGERPARRTHDRHEHVSIFVVRDIARGVVTKRVADLTVEGPVLPRCKSPGPDPSGSATLPTTPPA